MPTKTFLREYPEIFRTDKGIHLKVLGQTFTPRPGTDSFKALADKALTIQLTEAIESKSLMTDGQPREWSASYTAHMGQLTLIVHNALQVDETPVTVFMLADFKGSNLMVQRPKLFLNDNVLMPGLRTDHLTVAIELMKQLVAMIPELSARVDKLIINPDEEPKTTQTMVSYLRPGDAVLMPQGTVRAGVTSSGVLASIHFDGRTAAVVLKTEEVLVGPAGIDKLIKVTYTARKKTTGSNDLRGNQRFTLTYGITDVLTVISSTPKALARTLMAGDVIGWSFEGEPEVPVTLIEATPAMNGGQLFMRLSFTAVDEDPRSVSTRYRQLQDEVSLISRAN